MQETRRVSHEEPPRHRPHPPTQWQRIESHTRTLDRAIRMTQMADQKAAPVLALHVSLAAVTVSQSGQLGAVLRADGHTEWLAGAGWALLLAYACAALLAAWYIVIIYVPTAPRRGAARTHLGSIFYFDDIQAMPVDEFERLSIDMDIDNAERDVIRQVHTVSTIASTKLVGVQRAFFWSALALGAWLPLIVIGRL
ncbi:MAG: Pycsar system effector family protein [Dehalococcoidia bacterium]